jgi:hypothetical protein
VTAGRIAVFTLVFVGCVPKARRSAGPAVTARVAVPLAVLLDPVIARLPVTVWLPATVDRQTLALQEPPAIVNEVVEVTSPRLLLYLSWPIAMYAWPMLACTQAVAGLRTR